MIYGKLSDSGFLSDIRLTEGPPAEGEVEVAEMPREFGPFRYDRATKKAMPQPKSAIGVGEAVMVRQSPTAWSGLTAAEQQSVQKLIDEEAAQAVVRWRSNT